MKDIEKLIRRCQKKDSKAFDDLYKMYSSLIYGICLRYAKDTDDAKDLMQECFIKVLNNISSYEFKGSFEGWIRRVTVNNAVNYLKVKNRFLQEEIVDNDISDTGYNSDVISEMSAEDVIKIINKLPAGYRTIFNLRVIEDYKYNEIAEMLGITESTCRTQFKKARTYLMKLIEEEKYERF